PEPRLGVVHVAHDPWRIGVCRRRDVVYLEDSARRDGRVRHGPSRRHRCHCNRDTAWRLKILLQCARHPEAVTMNDKAVDWGLNNSAGGLLNTLINILTQFIEPLLQFIQTLLTSFSGSGTT